MGRWQSEYYDQVLSSKLKSLVCGAIERAKLEKDDPAPTISYENFVQDLDHGDSFTTTLVEILVKELAERKTRPLSTDRHLIAQRTAKSLRNLTQSTIFRDRSSASRRTFTNDFFVSHSGGATTLDWDVLTQHADDDDVDVEDDSGAHRYNAAEPVYHTFPDSVSSNTALRRSLPVQTTDPGTDDDLPLGYPTRRSPPAHFSLTRHPSLSRQSSIRRPARSRTNDFSEFTTRRRTSGRHDQATQSGDGSSSNSRTSVSGTGDSSSSMDIANLLHNHQSALGEDPDGPMPVSTFASSSAGNSLGRRGIPRVRSSVEDDPLPGESTSSPRFSPFILHTTGSATGAAPSSSRPHVAAPRLRRGGVRAPEQYAPAATSAAADSYRHSVRISSPPIPGLHNLSQRDDDQRLLLPRRSSSAEMEYIIQTASERFGSRSPRESSSLLGWGPNWNVQPGVNGGTASGSDNRQQASTPASLPTPRSISPENSSATE